jgi:hypothetical protein
VVDKCGAAVTWAAKLHVTRKRHENINAQSQTNLTREYGFDEGEKLENADGDSSDKTSSNTKQRARLPVTAHERG